MSPLPTVHPTSTPPEPPRRQTRRAGAPCLRSTPLPSPIRCTPGFTLIELLVVVAIIATLIAILIPSISSARRLALRTQCQANMRSIVQAHWLHITETNGRLLQAGLSHGFESLNPQASWLNALEKYAGGTLVAKSPVDDSPHWPAHLGGEGRPLPPANRLRASSYAVNNFLIAPLCPWGGPWTKIDSIRKPAAIVWLAMLARTGPYATADHIHADLWMLDPLPPNSAAKQLDLNAHGGPLRSNQSKANYGFLDGHAQNHRFDEVYTSETANAFDPAAGQP